MNKIKKDIHHNSFTYLSKFMWIQFMKALFLFVAALGASPSMAAANLVINGSFETLPESLNRNGNTWGQFAKLDGWQLLNGDKFEIQLATDFQNAETGYYRRFNPSSSDGTAHYLELNANRLGAIGQSFSTIVGQSYTLKFDYSGRSDSGQNNNSLANVYWGSKLVATLNEAPSSGWQTFTYTLTADSTTTLLAFQSLGPTARPTYGSYLDAISVTSTVPEPEYFAMFALGLVVVGFSIGRKSFSAIT